MPNYSPSFQIRLVCSTDMHSLLRSKDWSLSYIEMRLMTLDMDKRFSKMLGKRPVDAVPAFAAEQFSCLVYWKDLNPSTLGVPQVVCSCLLWSYYRAIWAYLHITTVFIAPYRPGSSNFGYLRNTALSANWVYWPPTLAGPEEESISSYSPLGWDLLLALEVQEMLVLRLIQRTK